MCPALSLVKGLFFRKAVCNCHNYQYGKTFWVHPGPLNCLPDHWKVGYIVKPFVCKQKRRSLQLQHPALDALIDILERPREIQDHPHPPFGLNFCETPCTSEGGFTHAMENRHGLNEPAGPPRTLRRHAVGYAQALRSIYDEFYHIAKQKQYARSDISTRWQRFSGSKREHYRQCYLEQEHNPLSRRPRTDVYHAGQTKWGELSARPRALLVQSVRSKGAPGVKPGTELRTPIAIEGQYRDVHEQVLHNWTSARKIKIMAAGMSLHKRARHLTKMHKPNHSFIVLDLKNFDGNSRERAVQERAEFLRFCTRLYGHDPELHRVLQTQDKATFRYGTVFGQIYGNRGSGTAGTSCGNKTVMMALLKYAMGPAFNKSEFLCDGDDTIIMCPTAETKAHLNSWVNRIKALGLTAKVEQVLHPVEGEDQLAQLRFCRAGIIHTSRGPMLCKDPLDATKVLTNFRRHFHGPYFRDYLQTLCVGIDAVYGDVPILSRFKGMLDVGGKVNKVLLESSGVEYMMTRHDYVANHVITDQARHSFWKTFGVPPSEQLRAEELIDTISVDFRLFINNL